MFGDECHYDDQGRVTPPGAAGRARRLTMERVGRPGGERMDIVRQMDEPLIVNVSAAPAQSHPRRARIIDFEDDASPWPDTGVNIQILQPGQPNCRYHSEPVQEDFLVLYGDCIVILDGEERPLRQWDFVHCPAGVEHVFVGAGAGPSAVLMIGSRRRDEAHYPVNAVAAKYDASVQVETDDPTEAYADWRQTPWAPTPNPWPLDGELDDPDGTRS